jgi:hypothetical protein
VPFLRLRQVCLVAADLAREAASIKALFGLEECYRDPNVARYGLENVLFPVGTDFIEIVAPTRPGTAAGRFLARHGGRHGYMLIMDCDDPQARQQHAAGTGVRTANLIRHGSYLGVQLHPKDTGGAMLEFNRTEGGEDPKGAYAPAGPAWQSAIRQDVTRRLVAAEIECPEPAAFAARWGELLQRPVKAQKEGASEIALDSGAIRFLPGTLPEAVFAGVELDVVDRDQVARAARDRGCLGADGEIYASGIRFRLAQAAAGPLSAAARESRAPSN